MKRKILQAAHGDRVEWPTSCFWDQFSPNEAKQSDPRKKKKKKLISIPPSNSIAIHILILFNMDV
jgi:hypothetical protein